MTERSPERRRRCRRRLLLVGALAVTATWLGVFRPWKVEIRPGSYLLLDVHGELPERPASRVFGRVLGEDVMSLLEMVALIDAAAKDTRVAGMVARIRSLDVGWAKGQEIRDALLAFRRAGKPLVAYLEREIADGILEYYIASAAEKVYVAPAVSAPLTGLVAHYTFLGGLWEKLDIEMDVEQVGRYKSAGDMIARKSMSPHLREMAESLLDNIFEQSIAGIAEGRRLEPGAVQEAIDAAPATVEELGARGLTDGARFLDELRTELVGPKRRFVPASQYRKAVDLFPTGRAKRKIAIVYGLGPIHVGAGRGGVVDGRTMGSDSIARALAKAAASRETAAIVFRIDSPGGSALASDLIWRATRKARNKKPVVASLSDVAASGGYYAAAGATKIIAQPGSVTGSIGVVVARPNVRGLLGRLGIATETLARGRHARLMSPTEPLSVETRRRVLETMNFVYDLFVRRVAEGRGLSPENVDALGQGRVWTGAQAYQNGLVDELGGLEAAISTAKREAGIPSSEEVGLVIYPEPEGLFRQLADALGARLPGVGSAGRLRSLLRAAALHDFPEGSVLTLMPGSLEIR